MGSPLPLSEGGNYPLARGRHPEDPPLGDPLGPGVPERVGLGVGGWEHYPFGECFPDIEPELAGYPFGECFPGIEPGLAG